METRLVGRMMVWLCCGYVWQLVISSRYPDRDGWAPVCPNCGEKGLSYKQVKEALKSRRS